jgi:hypothetical protein
MQLHGARLRPDSSRNTQDSCCGIGPLNLRALSAQSLFGEQAQTGNPPIMDGDIYPESLHPWGFALQDSSGLRAAATGFGEPASGAEDSLRYP